MDGAVQEDASPAFSLNENPAFDGEGEFDSLARSHTHDALSSPPREVQDAGKTKASLHAILIGQFLCA